MAASGVESPCSVSLGCLSLGTIRAIFFLVRAFFVCRLSLPAENPPLRQQVAVSKQSVIRLPLRYEERMRSVVTRIKLPVLVSIALMAASSLAAELPQSVRTFVEAHCIECHDVDSARAGFRIDTLGADFTVGDTANIWKEVMDKINSGQMPPKKSARLDAKEAFAVASWVAEKLDETTRAAQGAGGRVPMRRLNRVEYANTVRDIFSLEDNFARRIENELPADGKVGGFDRGAASLFMDEGQLDRYMAVADIVLDEGGVQRAAEGPETDLRRHGGTLCPRPHDRLQG